MSRHRFLTDGGAGRRSILNAVLVASALLVAGCNPFREREFQPRGTAFALNPEITLARIDGYSPCMNLLGLFQLGFYCRGGGDTVCDTLPAGLFFVPRSKEVQALIILKSHVIRVGPTDTIIPIGGFCCHSGRNAPDSVDVYDIGPLTDNAKLRQLIELVRNKDVTGGLLTIQQAVWEITDHNRLPQAFIDSINALPPDTGGAGLQSAGRVGRGLKSQLFR